MKTRLPSRLTATRGTESSGQGIWNGTISFSLVAIPVRLVKAVEPGRVSFRLLHRRDYSPLRRRMVCPAEEKIIPAAEQIRGYEIGPGHYLPVSDEELESLTPERSRTIEIVDFIAREEIDPLYFDHPYYLLPLKGGEKAYRLLAEAMARTRKAGLAKFVLGEREYLVAVFSTGKGLSLMTLHYPDEMIPAGDLVPEDDAADPAEKSRLMERIRAMTADFAPAKYADQRREKLLALLRKKGKRQIPVEAPVSKGEEEAAGPADLIAVLEESMRRLKGET